MKDKTIKDFKELTNYYKEKLEKRLSVDDYDGVVTMAKTYLESAIDYFSDFLLGDSANSLKKKQLLAKFNYLKKVIKLCPEKEVDNKIKSIFDSLLKIIVSLDSIANELGDRHSSLLLPKRYEAKFILSVSEILVDFLYERINFLYDKYPNETTNHIYEKLIKILDKSNNRDLSRKDLLEIGEIKSLFRAFGEDPYIVSVLKDKFIRDYEIENYRANDIFFAGMRLFFDNLNERDIVNIFRKCKDNPQAYPPYGHLLSFLFAVKKIKSECFLESKMKEFIDGFDKKTKMDELKKFKYDFNFN